MQQPILATSRLTLRPFTLEDAAAVAVLVDDEGIASTTLRIPHPYDQGMAEEWISSHPSLFTSGEGIVFALELIQNGQLAGSVGLRIDQEHSRAEMGYWIGKPYWNNGYATEAVGAVIQYGIEELELNRIYAAHLVRNPASGRVMANNGMSYEGRHRQHVRKWGVFEDLNYYAILKEEFTRR